MKEEERAALSAYRKALDAKTSQPQQAWGRLVSKIEVGAHPLPVDLAVPRRRWWLVAALGVAAAAGIAVWRVPDFVPTRSEAGTTPDQAVMQVEDQPPLVSPSEPPPRTAAPPAAVEVLEVPRPEPPSVPNPKPEPKPKPKAEPTLDVVAEANAIRQVQEAVRDGRAAVALRLLRRYRSRFPTGALRDEAALLQADALCLDGDRDAARRAAQAFVRAHPGSPLAHRAEGICAH